MRKMFCVIVSGWYDGVGIGAGGMRDELARGKKNGSDDGVVVGDGIDN